MNKLKIAFVCTYNFLRAGGVQDQIRSLSIELRKRGHSVCVIAPRIGDQKNEEGIFLFGTGKRVGLHGTQTEFCYLSRNETKRLKSFLRERQFDVLHYHNVWNPLFGFQVLANSKHGSKKTKNVVTYHDAVPRGLWGKVLENVVVPVVGFIINKSSMDLVLSSSEVSKKPLAKLDKKVHVISNGINLDNFNPERCKPFEQYLDGKINIFYIGRLEERKGIMYLLSVFRFLNQRYNLRLLIAGKGKQKKEIRDFINKYHLHNVKLLGEVSEEDKMRYFATSDICVFPSLYGESFGIVLIEAMAFGKPVIGGKNPGYATVLVGEGRKFLVDPKDVRTFINRLEKLIINPELRKRMGGWGLQEVKKHDIKKIAERLEGMYYSILNWINLFLLIFQT